jgi:hypothetical protein
MVIDSVRTRALQHLVPGENVLFGAAHQRSVSIEQKGGIGWLACGAKPWS